MYDLLVLDGGLHIVLAGVTLMAFTGEDATLVARAWRELGPWRGDDFLHGLLYGAAYARRTGYGPCRAVVCDVEGGG